MLPCWMYDFKGSQAGGILGMAYLLHPSKVCHYDNILPVDVALKHRAKLLHPVQQVSHFSCYSASN